MKLPSYYRVPLVTSNVLLAALCGQAGAQTIIEPSYGVAKLEYLQAEDGSDGETVQRVTRQLKAVVPANSEVLIPLGEFVYARVHKLSVNTSGDKANSSGHLTFSTPKNWNTPLVMSESKMSSHSRYKLLSYKASSSRIGVVLSYKNDSLTATNTVKVSYDGLGNWGSDYKTPSQTEIDSLLPIYPRLHIAAGIEYAADGYSLAPGVYVEGSPVLTEATAPTLFANDFVSIPSTNSGSSDSFLLEGNYGGAGSIPVEGAGSRMMWYPEKSAFRVGKVSGSNWDEGNVGNYSVAMGYNTNASGAYSTAMGQGDANGDSSTAMGQGTAYGDYSTAMGYGSAEADYSTAMGSGYAWGVYSTAMGSGSAEADYATAMGNSWATGEMSTSMGNAYASGSRATAMGGMASAHGDYSTAMGQEINATSFASTAIGFGNEDRYTHPDASTMWQGDDQHSVFEVGIGESANSENALTILQDGSIELGKATATDNSIPLHVKANGDVIIAKAQGDISMGAFGN